MTNSARADVLVILPAYNEQSSLATVIEDLRDNTPNVDLLVVDDGSTDATANVARSLGVPTLALPYNIGVGGAIRAGLLYAGRAGYRAVVQCDADGQHPAEHIMELVNGLEGSDLVIGARFSGIGSYPARGPRRWVMWLLAKVFSAIHGTELNDVTSGFRAFGARSIEVLSHRMPPEYLGDTVEALIIAKQARLTVTQLPVIMRERQAGTPSQNPLRATLFTLRVVVVLALSLLQLILVRKERGRG